MCIRVLLFEDNKDIREGYSFLIKSNPAYELAGVYANCDNIVSIVKNQSPDILLMDIEMPGTNGIEGLKRVRSFNQDLKILMLTVFEDNTRVFEAIQAGASGYLLKKTSPTKIFEAMEDVLQGGASMTPSIAAMVIDMLAKGYKPKALQKADTGLSIREKEILSLMVKGYSYKLIAADAGISIDTVKTHIKNIYEKLQVHTRTDLITRTLRDGIV